MSPAVIVQTLGRTATTVVTVAASVLGTAMLAAVLAGAVALVYRWYVREAVPAGLALLVGLSGVAIIVNTTSLLAREIADTGGDIEVLTALFNITVFAVGGAGAYAGLRVGDALGRSLFAATAGDIDADVGEIVQSVGRVTSVRLPEEIDDVVGYDPMPEATRQTLAGRTFLFPRRLTRAELRERLVSRLKSDYGVGHVDVELGEDGGVDYLAVGSRAAGIGPTLPPATNAVAIRADPAHAASPGDLIQVWETDPARRVLTGELRGVTGDVVTVAIDAADTPKVDPTEQYRIVTLPVQDRPDREFASLLRAADETLATVTVGTGSALDGTRIGSLSVTVAAITREDERPDPLPLPDRTLAPGDVVYAIATPDALRRLEDAAGTPDEAAPATDRSGEGDRAATPEGPESAPVAGTGSPDDRAATVESDEPVDDPGTSPESESVSDDPGTSPESVDVADPSDGEESTGEEGVADGEGTSSDDAPGDTVAEASSAGEDDVADPTDEASLEGDAFPDADELPGLDPETAAPTVADEESEDTSGPIESTAEQGPDGSEEESASADPLTDAFGEPVDASERESSPESTGESEAGDGSETVEDALEGFEPLDPGGESPEDEPDVDEAEDLTDLLDPDEDEAEDEDPLSDR